MPFDAGNLSLAICHLDAEMPHDALELFQEKKAGALANVAEEPKVGWVTGRHLLDTDLTEETAYVAGYLHLVLRTAQRKIPASLLKAECRIEELAYMQANNLNAVNRKQRKQIKEEVTDRLIKQMPPTLSGIPFVADAGQHTVFMGASSLSRLDSLLGYFSQTLHLDPIPLSPEAAADHLFDLEPLDIPILDFSPERVSDVTDVFLGRDFTTWLWYFQEMEGGQFTTDKGHAYAIAIDGPLHFIGEASSALESVVRKGLPTTSAEAKAALLVGKKLKQAKFTIARGNQQWTFTLDADNFLFRGLSLPPGEELDARSHFQERILLLHEFKDAFFTLYGKYLADVTDDARRDRLQKKLHAWVESLKSA